MDVFKLRDQVIDEYGRYVRSFLNVRDPTRLFGAPVEPRDVIGETLSRATDDGPGREDDRRLAGDAGC